MYNARQCTIYDNAPYIIMHNIKYIWPCTMHDNAHYMTMHKLFSVWQSKHIVWQCTINNNSKSMKMRKGRCTLHKDWQCLICDNVYLMKMHLITMHNVLKLYYAVCMPYVPCVINAQYMTNAQCMTMHNIRQCTLYSKLYSVYTVGECTMMPLHSTYTVC